MRRLSIIAGLCAALAVPAGALSATRATSDGSLVVRHGQAPAGTPVVALTITGSVIGNLDHGRVWIDPGPNADPSKAPLVTQNAQCNRLVGETILRCSGDNFSFRAVGGRYVVLVWGTNVNLVAVGTGSVKLAGMPGTSVGDGKYALNGADFLSLPGAQTDRLAIASTSSNG